jgi:hypothetical protein
MRTGITDEITCSANYRSWDYTRRNHGTIEGIAQYISGVGSLYTAAQALNELF